MPIDLSTIPRPLSRGAIWLLVSAAIVCATHAVEAADVSCPVSPLKKLMALDSKRFEIRRESLEGHSTEGGTLIILSRKGEPQRVRAELFGETGRVAVDVGYFDGDILTVARWTEYVEPLPKMPVRFKKVDTLAGFFCSGVLVIDRQGSADIEKDKISQFRDLTLWLLSELRSRGVAWNPRLSVEN